MFFGQLSALHKKLLQLVAAAVGIAFLDQLSKWVVLQTFPGIMQLNAGISFGWFVTDQVLLCVVLLLILVAVILVAFRHTWEKQPVIVGIFLGGVLSNVMDRVIWGGVRDWLPIPLTSLKNNLADWSIVFVLVILAVQELRTVSSNKKEEA